MHSIQALFAFSPTSYNLFYVAQTDDTILDTALDILFLPSAQRPSVISFSYSFDASDVLYMATDQGRTDVELIQLGLLGTTVIVAAGDDGAPSASNPNCYGNLNSLGYGVVTNSAGPMLPLYPASSPYVLSVGMTDFWRTSAAYWDPTITSPAVCNNCQDVYSSGGYLCQGVSGGEQPVSSTNTNRFLAIDLTTGGGFSSYAPLPSWQSSAVNGYLSHCAVSSNGCPLPPSTYFNRSNRAYPDVAAFGGYWPTVVNGELSQVGGSSVAAPLMAGIVARLNEVVVARTGRTLGFANPTFYAMAAAQPSTFHDLTTGNNICTRGSNAPANCASICSGYYATTGYDPITGLGSPNVHDMTSWLTSNLPAGSPPTPATGSCSYSIQYPPTAYPSLAGSITGAFTYDKVSSHSYTQPGYPTGYQLLSHSGTRVVTQATASHPTTYTTTSSAPFVLAPTTSVLPNNEFDNVFYPSCSTPLHVDHYGWGLLLSVQQPQTLVSNPINGVTYYVANTYASAYGLNLTDYIVSGASSAGGVYTSLICDGVDLVAQCSGAAPTIPSVTSSATSSPSTSRPSPSSSSVPQSSAFTTSPATSPSTAPIIAALTSSPSSFTSSLPVTSTVTASPLPLPTSMTISSSSSSSSSSHPPSSGVILSSSLGEASGRLSSATAPPSSMSPAVQLSSSTASSFTSLSLPSLSSTGGVSYETCGLDPSLVGPLGSAFMWVYINGTFSWDCTPFLSALVAASPFPLPSTAVGGASLPANSQILISVSSAMSSPVLPIIGAWRSALINVSSPLHQQMASLGFNVYPLLQGSGVQSSCGVGATTYQMDNYCDTGAGYAPYQCQPASAIASQSYIAAPGSLLTSFRVQADVTQLPITALTQLSGAITSALSLPSSSISVFQTASAQPQLYSQPSGVDPAYGVSYVTLILHAGGAVSPSDLYTRLQYELEGQSGPVITALQLIGSPPTVSQTLASALTVCSDGGLQCSCPSPSSSSTQSSSLSGGVIGGIVAGAVVGLLLLVTLCVCLLCRPKQKSAAPPLPPRVNMEDPYAITTSTSIEMPTRL